MYLVIEKGLPDNNFGYRFFLQVFTNVIALDILERKEVAKGQTNKKGKNEKKTEANKLDIQKKNEMDNKLREEQAGKFTKQKFYFFVYFCSQIIMEGAQKPLDQFLEIVLAEKQERKKDQSHSEKPLRNLIVDEQVKKLLTEEAIQCLIDFERDAKYTYLFYIAENYEAFSKKGEIVTSNDLRTTGTQADAANVSAEAEGVIEGGQRKGERGTKMLLLIERGKY